MSKPTKASAAVATERSPLSYRPGWVALDPDEDQAKYVGWTRDKRQIFVTNAFVPQRHRQPSREFVVRYVFEKQANLRELTVEDWGPRPDVDVDALQARMKELFEEFGPMKRKRIEFRPFRMVFNGVPFGLIERPPEEEGGPWAVDAQPGDYMAFFPPFNSGLYDT